MLCLYVTVFWKTDHLHTKTEIHLLPVRDRHTHALSRNTKYQTIDCQVCFYRLAFCWCCETTRVHFMVLGCVNRTAWGTKLLLTAVWASLVDCIRSCHLLKAQHCPLSPNGRFTPPSAPHPPPPPTPPPSHLPTSYRINPWYYRIWKKLSQKPAGFK